MIENHPLFFPFSLSSSVHNAQYSMCSKVKYHALLMHLLNANILLESPALCLINKLLCMFLFLNLQIADDQYSFANCKHEFLQPKLNVDLIKALQHVIFYGLAYSVFFLALTQFDAKQIILREQ